LKNVPELRPRLPSNPTLHPLLVSRESPFVLQKMVFPFPSPFGPFSKSASPQRGHLLSNLSIPISEFESTFPTRVAPLSWNFYDLRGVRSSQVCFLILSPFHPFVNRPRHSVDCTARIPLPFPSPLFTLAEEVLYASSKNHRIGSILPTSEWTLLPPFSARFGSCNFILCNHAIFQKLRVHVPFFLQ